MTDLSRKFAANSVEPRRPSLAIVVTNHNRWDLIERFLSQCNVHDSGNFDRLLIYDDCSTVQHALSLPPKCILHAGSPNLGLTRSLNRALAMLSEEIIIIFDSDAFPLLPFCRDISGMFTSDESLGLVAFQTIGAANQPTESFSTEPNVWSLVLGQAIYAKFENWLADKSGRVSVFTCAMAVRKAAFQDVGGFDEAFDWLDLDHDLSMRINRSKWKTAICRGHRVFHEGGGSDQQTRHRVLRHYKNRWYLLRKFGRIPLPRLVKLIILARLHVEFLILAALGKTLIKDASERQEKILCRKQLIALCKSTY
jgi:GT2 family glycosyltransferase